MNPRMGGAGIFSGESHDNYNSTVAGRRAEAAESQDCNPLLPASLQLAWGLKPHSLVTNPEPTISEVLMGRSIKNSILSD